MKRRIVTLVLFVLAVGLAYWALREHVTLATLIVHEGRLRRLVTEYPVASLVVGFVIYVATSLVPGTSGKSFVYGWLFGFWPALLLVNVALTLAAIISFLAIRYVFQEMVHERFGPWVSRIDEALRHDGPFYLLSVRLLHVPYSLTNYVVGATKAPARTFWWTTHLGLLPGNVALVLAGSQLPTLEQLTEEGALSLINVPLLFALSLITLLPVATRWAIGYLRASNEGRLESNCQPTRVDINSRRWSPRAGRRI